MTDLVQRPLSDWDSFYVIVGSSAAALIGIQFVVITLVATLRKRPDAGSIGAFATPTVAHLTGALVISALMSVPWPSLVPAAVVLALCGGAGLGYGGVVIRRARGQSDYRPVWEDWVWYLILPLVAWATLAVGALVLCTAPRSAEFVIGTAALGLLFIGIHNAWDSVTHVTITSARDTEKPE